MKAQEATEELNYLMNLNQSITLAMARTMQGLSDFVFVNMAKITLSTCDTYLDHLKSGIKHDTLHPSIWADFFCTVSSRKLRTRFLMITSITPVPLTRNHYSITPMLSQINRHRAEIMTTSLENAPLLWSEQKTTPSSKVIGILKEGYTFF